MAETLERRIADQSNDYSLQERTFKERTGLELVTTGDQNESDIACRGITSVIIPCYNGEGTLPQMIRSLNDQSNTNFEVIIVDDGSHEDVFHIIQRAKPGFRTRFVRQGGNYGRSFTRNTGIQLAEGDAVIFADQDIVFDRDFIQRFMLRNENTSDCVLLGFKQEVNSVQETLGRVATHEADWRSEIETMASFLPLHPRPINSERLTRIYRILVETDYLKLLGNSATIGFWDLSSMVIAHGICTSREAAIAAGGFPEQGFKGWGGEDVAFGARLIGQGSYVVPVPNNAYFHIAHARHSGSRAIEMSELAANLQSYFGLLQAPKPHEPPAQRTVREIGSSNNIEVLEVCDVR